MNGLSPERRDILFLMLTRAARSFAAGFLAVVIGLYYLESLHLSATLIGLLFATGAFVTPILSFVLGRYADNYGRKKVLLITMTFLPAAIAILIFTSYFPLLLLSAALGGFGIAGGLVGGGVGASVAPMQIALLAEKTNARNRTKVFSVFQMLSTSAGSAGALLSYIHDYTLLFYIGVACGIASWILFLPVKESFKPLSRKSNEARTPLSTEDRKTIQKFTVTGAFMGSAQGFYIPFLSIVFSVYFHASNGQIGTLFAVGGVLTAASLSLTPSLTGKLGYVKFIIVSRGVSAVCALFVPFAVSFFMASGFYLVSTFSRGMSTPAQSSLMMSLVSEGRRATATGSNQTARLAPSALATAFSGYLLDTFSIYVPFVASFLFTATNLFLYQKFFGDKATSARLAKDTAPAKVTDRLAGLDPG